MRIRPKSSRRRAPIESGRSLRSACQSSGPAQPDVLLGGVPYEGDGLFHILWKRRAERGKGSEGTGDAHVLYWGQTALGSASHSSILKEGAWKVRRTLGGKAVSLARKRRELLNEERTLRNTKQSNPPVEQQPANYRRRNTK